MAKINHDVRDRRHIDIALWREQTAYAFPSRDQRRKPTRLDYEAHANALLASLAEALPPLPEPGADTREAIPGLAAGALVVLETQPLAEGSRSKASKTPAGFDFPGQDIVVLRSERRDDRTEAAVVFVPDQARDFLSGRIGAYGRDPGNRTRPDKDRFEAVERFQAAEAAALFAPGTDFAGAEVWWELWVRAAPGLAEGVAAAARNRELDVHDDRLVFPDTLVVLVHGAPMQLLALAAAMPGAVTEVRRAMGTIAPFLERGETRIGQADFVADLAGRVTEPPDGAPVVGLLDTGVAAGHPLIAPGLAAALAYDDAWGTDDHAADGGHGTGLASLALYGDLSGPMQDLRDVTLTHRVASLKLLPPGRGFEVHAPRHYGIVTQGAVARIEIDHGQTRTYLLATSTEEFSAARPSSWSGALDQLASGSAPGEAGDPPRPAAARPKRLVVVAAGNVAGGMRDEVAQSGAIEDPAQSWNALTVGGYTAKVNLGLEDWQMTAVAAANEVSPFSRHSADLPDDLTPIKPEVLFEAGNMLADHMGYCAWSPSVSLLAAGSDVAGEPLAPIWATSAATGMAGHFFGRLEAALPGLWPETYRALAVQSADWPTPIRKRLIGRGQHWKSGKTATKTLIQKILRRVGYGVPNLERAVASARNDVTLLTEAEIQPFALGQDGRSGVYNAMHFYDLPFPRAALEALENETVVMKVTLSYFIEPNLTGRAATRPDTYRSFGLRFAMKKRGETDAAFRARVNAAQEKGEPGEKESSYWLLGPKAVNAGSLHCDLWRGRAIDLAGHDSIAIYPVGGWWKSHVGQRRMTDTARYSLMISLSAPGQAVDMHAEIEALVEAKAAEIVLNMPAGG